MQRAPYVFCLLSWARGVISRKKRNVDVAPPALYTSGNGSTTRAFNNSMHLNQILITTRACLIWLRHYNSSDFSSLLMKQCFADIVNCRAHNVSVWLIKWGRSLLEVTDRYGACETSNAAREPREKVDYNHLTAPLIKITRLNCYPVLRWEQLRGA